VRGLAVGAVCVRGDSIGEENGGIKDSFPPATQTLRKPRPAMKEILRPDKTRQKKDKRDFLNYVSYR